MERKDVVLIDPPWNYKDKPPKAVNPLSYSLWQDNDKCLELLFTKVNCDYLLVWVTNSFLYNLLRVDHYPFQYKGIVTWLKLTKNGKDFYGLGNYFRNCTEQLVLFTWKGSEPLRLLERNIIKAVAGKETEKPKEFEYNLFKSLKERGLDKSAYIFSGTNVEVFKEFDMDAVDTKFFEKKKGEKI